MSHPSFCFFAIFCIPSLLSLLLIPPTCPILSYSPLSSATYLSTSMCSSIGHYIPHPFILLLHHPISLFCFPCSTALHSLPLFFCTSIFYHIPPFPVLLLPTVPHPFLPCSSTTHHVSFPLFLHHPQPPIHFSFHHPSFLYSPITCHILSLLVFYHHPPSIPPSLTCHLTSASHPFLPSLTMSYSALCFSITMSPFFLCSPVSHHVPSLLPMICHLCISFFPALFFHLPSLLSAFLHHPPHPIHPSCVPPSPTTSHPLLSSWTFHHLISFLPPPPPCLLCLHPPSPRLFLSCSPCQHFTIPSLPP